ncbi:trypsin-like peptidase domain-containing protein [Staphylococcus equorum]|uniref:Serine protease HtrA-like n=1 Tax=Staphylococcus equorum TaxID=246432 RepID=A0A9X4R159_9STAP|nr:serine protease [Staphylococcus equorum]MDG0843273.1 trypsin-like peptidase domain-containing protein [Staphylococcus equorum]MDG0858840.1 trypsin-like peptidase domain-containing protein [Staphylococcus equorum]
MTQNKKHVIPKEKYGRKRREFFHNEEREQRLHLEHEAREQREEKAQKLAKNNEERVKENLRKARIEKLTQEEIQQQQALMAKQSSSKEDINTTSDKQTSDKEQSTSHPQKQNAIHHTHSNSELVTDYRRDNKENDNVVSDKGALSKNQPSKIGEEDNFYSEEAQQSRVEQYIEEDDVDVKEREKEQTTERNKYKSQQKEPSHANQHGQLSGVDRVKYFFKKHWPKVLIVIAVILLLTLMNAIFTNVDQNGNEKDSIFQSNNGKEKAYTATMKSANSATHSVVTVENDTSNKGSSAEKETQEAGKENELGSGVVYKKVGDSIFIMTNAHVVGDKEEQKITYGNGDYSIGKVIGTDKFSDIAVVKAKVKSGSDVKPIKMGDSSTLVLGEPIIVVGNPLGVDFKGSVSEGIVSGLNRHIPADIDKDEQYDVLMDAFQIDAPVNPGNSGGGVINRDGKLIGIASLKIDMDNVEGIAFAIPVNQAESIAKELEAKGEVKYPNTGIRIMNVADIDDEARQSLKLPEDVKSGVIIGEVKENSTGEKSGLQKNDVIVELDGKELEDNLRYRQVIFNHKDDLDTLPAKIYRDGKLKDIKIKLK